MSRLILPVFLLCSTLAFAQHTFYFSGPNQDQFRAIVSDDADALRQALKKGANVNATCKIRTDPNSPVKTMTNECLWEDYKDDCTTDPNYGVQDPFEESFTPLYVATRLKRDKMVQILFDAGADAYARSTVCSFLCEPECYPYVGEQWAHYNLLTRDDTDDGSLRIATLYAQRNLLDSISPYIIFGLLNNKNISDKALADFIRLMSRLNKLEADLATAVDIVDDKPYTTLDLALRLGRPETGDALRSAGVKVVYYFEEVEPIGEYECTDNCYGTVLRIHYNDGSEKIADFRRWAT